MLGSAALPLGLEIWYAIGVGTLSYALYNIYMKTLGKVVRRLALHCQ